MLYMFAYIVIRPFLLLLYRPKVKNYKALWQKGKVIYVGNHVVLADPIAIGILSPRVIHFMAKSTLSEKPFMRWLFRSLKTFPVRQYSADRKALKEAISLLERGKAFGIFPEGHRNVDMQTMDAFDKGVSFIALRADAPIVPVYVVPGGFQFGHRLRVAVGDPIYPAAVKEECPAKKTVDALTDRIMDTMLTLREQAEAL